MRAYALILATLTLIVFPAPTKADPKDPDRDRLGAREKALRRSDTNRAAKDELAAARRWLVLAGWARDEGEEQQQRRKLQLAELQLDLVQRVVSLARLRAEVDRLERALERTKKAIVKDSKRLKQRGEYLDVLRSTR